MLCTAEPMAWVAIEALEMYDIPVVSLTSDGAKLIAASTTHVKNSGKESLKLFVTKKPMDSERMKMYFFCDAPHLLKISRNCFSNSFSPSQSKMMQVFCLLWWYDVSPHNILWCLYAEKWPNNQLEVD